MITKIIDLNSLWARLLISFIVTVASFLVMSRFSFQEETRLALTVIVFVLSFILTFLDGIVRGIEGFKKSADRSIEWLGIVSDYGQSAGVEIDKLLAQIVTIRDKITQRRDSAYAVTATKVLQGVIYQLTELANDEYRTTGQAALDSYVAFMDSLGPTDRYCATSTVGVPAFWRDTYIGPRSFEANKRALKRGARIKRIFFLPPVRDIERYRAVRDEAKKHQDAGIEVVVVLEESVPSEYRRDFGIFNSSFVSYFELGPKESFLGIRFYFSDKEVDNAERLYLLIEDSDALKSHGHKSLDDLFFALEAAQPKSMVA